MTSGRLRADAERNRAALLAAAREVFGEQGLDASLDEIARRAGVGNATLYRRFPTRADLIAAVFAEHRAAQLELAERALRHGDPWAAFAGYVTALCELQAADRGLAEILVTVTFDDDERLGRLRATSYRRAALVIRRARAAGVLRPDFRLPDLALLLMANAAVAHRSRDPRAWRRQLALVLDGLATPHRHPR